MSIATRTLLQQALTEQRIDNRGAFAKLLRELVVAGGGGGSSSENLFGDGSDGPKTFTAAGNGTPANELPSFANYTTLRIESGAIVTGSQTVVAAYAIRCSVSAVVLGKIDLRGASNFAPGGGEGLVPYAVGASVGGAGGGGGGTGSSATQAAQASILGTGYSAIGGDGAQPSSYGYAPLTGPPPGTSVGQGGGGGNATGESGKAGTAGVGAFTDRNDTLLALAAKCYPAGPLSDFLFVPPGADGGDGGSGGGAATGIAAGGAGGAGGSSGGSLYLIAPAITLGGSSEIDLSGLNGSNGTNGQPGVTPLTVGAGGGGGGGGAGGGNGGSGGIAVTIASSIAGTWGVTTLTGGTKGLKGTGGAAGSGNAGGGDGGAGGDGSDGADGTLGAVFSYTLPPAV